MPPGPRVGAHFVLRVPGSASRAWQASCMSQRGPVGMPAGGRAAKRYRLQVNGRGTDMGGRAGRSHALTSCRAMARSWPGRRNQVEVEVLEAASRAPAPRACVAAGMDAAEALQHASRRRSARRSSADSPGRAIPGEWPCSTGARIGFEGDSAPARSAGARWPAAGSGRWRRREQRGVPPRDTVCTVRPRPRQSRSRSWISAST